MRLVFANSLMAVLLAAPLSSPSQQGQINPNQIARGAAITTLTPAAAIGFCGSTPACEWHINGAASALISVTIPANIALVFEGGGQLAIASGAIVTINGAVQASDTAQIFSGGAVVFGGAVPTVPLAWFGAKGDGLADDTASIQATINSCLDAGCYAMGRRATYRTTAPLIILRNAGLAGPETVAADNGQPAETGTMKILSTSPSATVLNLGPPGNGSCCQYIGAKVKNLELGRTTLPAVGSQGLAINTAVTYDIDRVKSSDSYSAIYAVGGTVGDTGLGLQHVVAGWGRNGVTGYPTGASLVALDLDGTNQAENSLYVHGISTGSFPSGVITTLIRLHGAHVNDVNIWQASIAGASHGLVIDYDGNGGFDTDYDVHLYSFTFDQCHAECILINNITARGSVVLSDGYAIANTSLPAVSLVNSAGVHINTMEAGNTYTGDAVLLTNSGLNIIRGLECKLVAGGDCLRLNASDGNVISDLLAVGGDGPIHAGLELLNYSLLNTVSNVRVDGGGTFGIHFDATSSFNQLVAQNTIQFSPGSISGPFFDESTYKQVGANCPAIGLPDLVLDGSDGAAGPGATVAFNTSTPFANNNCNFTVDVHTGATTGAGPLFAAYFTVAHPTNTSGTLGVVHLRESMGGGYTCKANPVSTGKGGPGSNVSAGSATSLPYADTTTAMTTIYAGAAPPVNSVVSYNIRCEQ